MTGQTKSSMSKADVPRRAPDCTLVIFGGGGDLTKRLLVPSLYDLRRWTFYHGNSASSSLTGWR